MAVKKKGLGRGLDALLSDNNIEVGGDNSGVTLLRVMDIEPNPKQARRKFEREQLEELAASISRHGILQPIVVRSKPNGFYEIIAGERRWRASKLLGLTEVPVIVKEVSEGDAAELSLIENLQRENLNPVEEANGYKALTETYGLTQEEAASRVGKSRTAVANVMRILKLPQSVLALVEEGALSYGHARTLLPLCDKLAEDEVLAKAQYVIKEQLSVRDTEKLVKSVLEAPAPKEKDRVAESYYKQLERRISETMGRRVSISRDGKGGGKLALSYGGTEDLEALLKKLCGKNFFEDNE
ncbi:MAG: ParB/RepB/Spo0J family partition protein [Ruminococcaceae bacterium]|nr:ParB/RepB/Spo0J family partition protein [Oscillospiraceae bacterium]